MLGHFQPVCVNKTRIFLTRACNSSSRVYGNKAWIFFLTGLDISSCIYGAKTGFSFNEMSVHFQMCLCNKNRRFLTNVNRPRIFLTRGQDFFIYVYGD